MSISLSEFSPKFSSMRYYFGSPSIEGAVFYSDVINYYIAGTSVKVCSFFNPAFLSGDIAGKANFCSSAFIPLLNCVVGTKKKLN